MEFKNTKMWANEREVIRTKRTDIQVPSRMNKSSSRWLIEEELERVPLPENFKIKKLFIRWGIFLILHSAHTIFILAANGESLKEQISESEPPTALFIRPWASYETWLRFIVLIWKWGGAETCPLLDKFEGSQKAEGICKYMAACQSLLLWERQKDEELVAETFTEQYKGVQRILPKCWTSGGKIGRRTHQ